ncbi:hypothetical protein [Cupriavidus lacunae]|uniref:Uncharacterized protein n=1 Tax=Cupriavidus lacunae TaxID=2666307 RepID=A0A370P2L9_9BURK|nr:hypothetical protein [Cupriavidus lacunae]RDK12086.1 hypothetical protein DN412_00615 [Cupriavidus lacunae]
MRTLLYFRLDNIAAARRAQAQLGELAATAARIDGPWFFQRDALPAEGLPAPKSAQTTYLNEVAVAGLAAGALLMAWIVFRYGTPASAPAGFLAYLGGMALGAMIGWCLGGALGARILRAGLRRQKRQMAAGQLVMVCACNAQSKGRLCEIAQDAGAAGIDPQDGRLPLRGWLADRHWPTWLPGHGQRAIPHRKQA